MSVYGPERTWGVLAAFTARPQGFTGEDAAFFQGVAHVLTMAMRREDGRG